MLSADYSSQFRLEDLQRDLPFVSQVVVQVDRGHPALTDLALEGVAALEGCVQAGDGIWGVQAPKMRLRASNREHGSTRSSELGRLLCRLGRLLGHLKPADSGI